MSIQPFTDLHVRSYGPRAAPDRHAFAQLVLPVAGAVMLEIEGREGRLDPLHGALVAPGAWHTQSGTAGNRSLIVDVDTVFIDAQRERLLERPFTALPPAARKLVDYLALMAGAPAAGGVLANWVPLLLDTLAASPVQPASRLAALRARVEAEPGLPWTTAAMAQAAGVGVSRLHALFRSELDTSPHAWLLALRLDRACTWLAAGTRPIADVALAAGFSDQSALTRAMRDALGVTPAAYRRAVQDSSKTP
jgi:AraC-like DNA-binding protein